MRRFFNRSGLRDLESELRSSRPEPRSELLDQLVSRVEASPAHVPARRPRFAAAFVFAVVIVLALAAFGGAGYAKASVTSAAKSCKHAVTAVVKGDNSPRYLSNSRSDDPKSNHTKSKPNDPKSNNTSGGNNNGEHGNNGDGIARQFLLHQITHDPPWVHQYSRFVLVCYRFSFGSRTIIVPRDLVPFIVPAHASLGICHR